MADRRIRFAVGVVVLAGALGLPAAAAEPVAALRGQWSGTIAERSAAGLPDGRIEVRLDGSAERFALAVAAPGGALLEGKFESGQRPGVWGPPATGKLMSYLGRGAPANPLEGKPLAWARREGEGMVVYRLDLRDGAHRLERVALVPDGDRVSLVFERRDHDRAPERFRATLHRSGR